MLELAGEDLPGLEDERGHRDARGDADLQRAGAAPGEGEGPQPEAVVGDRAARGEHAGAGVEKLSLLDRPSDPLARAVEPPGLGAGVHDLAVDRGPLEHLAGRRAERDGEPVAAQPGGQPSGPSPQARAQPVVVVEDGGIDAHAGERCAAPLAGDEVEASARQDLAGEVAPEVFDRATGADHLGHGVAGAEREHAEARRRDGAGLGPVEDVVHPGDEGPVAPAGEDGSESTGDDRVGDAVGVVPVPGEEEALGGHEPRKGFAHARAHLLRVGVQEDGGLLSGAARGVSLEHRVPCSRV